MLAIIQSKIFSLPISYQKIYKTVILPVVLYGCETSSLNLREELRLQVFENSVFRWIFGPKREENKSWRKLYNKSMRMRWTGHVARMGERYLQGFGWEARR
jgi:hypothetical protein